MVTLSRWSATADAADKFETISQSKLFILKLLTFDWLRRDQCYAGEHNWQIHWPAYENDGADAFVDVITLNGNSGFDHAVKVQHA